MNKTERSILYTAVGLLAVGLLVVASPLQAQGEPPAQCAMCDDYFSYYYQSDIHLFEDGSNHPTTCNGGAGCHEDPNYDECYVWHGYCEMSAAIDEAMQDLYDNEGSVNHTVLVALASGYPEKVHVNPARQSVQLQDCADRLVFDIPLAETALGAVAGATASESSPRMRVDTR